MFKGTDVPTPEEHRGTSHSEEELHVTEKKKLRGIGSSELLAEL